MKFAAISILLFIHFSNSAIAQKSVNGRQLYRGDDHTKTTTDSLEFLSKKLTVLYTLTTTKDIKGEFFRKGDLIFNDSINKVSKLYIKNRNGSTSTVATIPIDNVIIDDAQEIIICLSRAEISPYHIVLYNFSGELLFKKKFLPLELVLDSLNYIYFKDSFGTFFQYAKNHKQITQVQNLHFLDLDYWHLLTESQKKKISDLQWLKPSHFFPELLPENIDGNSSRNLSKYTNFYSQTDPFFKFEMHNSKPITIVLNNEFGEQVMIPIILD